MEETVLFPLSKGRMNAELPLSHRTSLVYSKGIQTD
jgi:hypothetical protein